MTIIKLTTESRSRRKKSFRVRCNPRLVRETCFRYCRNTKRVAFSAIGAQRSELKRPLRAGRPAHGRLYLLRVSGKAFASSRPSFSSLRERQHVAVLSRPSEDLALVVSRNFSHIIEMRSKAVGAYGAIVKDSACRFVAKHSARFALTAPNARITTEQRTVGENFRITCRIFS
jgi:hypothetical protein